MRYLVWFLFVALCKGFLFPSQLQYPISTLRMGKGKRLDEVGLSRKAIFQKFKKTFNEAAQKDGFFDLPGPHAVSITYCKLYVISYTFL
jgi:hypothetical protein